ncbi:WXG100 family type VII secretion target [Glaciibacter psychrotolerans]|uniref:ESAT-6-like protein n=1 Tax=Glaciibacter psychrotolerans TaxID=670054 RepID=A0A7Z0EC84_9MICO|nr:WXG100 family type VII secretion target [Leifsonia psychrotolerans]NYJ18257.1 WXG100 family type VII secretion target [Leifsonia psychrotolerans]
MTRYQVDSEAVLGTTTAVHGSIMRIQGEVSGLLAQLTNLEASWSGQAASAFQGVVSEWRGTQHLVEESLANINQALSQAGQQYAEIEQSNARLFGR